MRQQHAAAHRRYTTGTPVHRLRGLSFGQQSEQVGQPPLQALHNAREKAAKPPHTARNDFLGERWSWEHRGTHRLDVPEATVLKAGATQGTRQAASVTFGQHPRHTESLRLLTLETTSIPTKHRTTCTRQGVWRADKRVVTIHAAECELQTCSNIHRACLVGATFLKVSPHTYTHRPDVGQCWPRMPNTAPMSAQIGADPLAPDSEPRQELSPKHRAPNARLLSARESAAEARGLQHRRPRARSGAGSADSRAQTELSAPNLARAHCATNAEQMLRGREAAWATPGGVLSLRRMGSGFSLDPHN